jgi:predicted GNAT family acetyltransferase
LEGFVLKLYEFDNVQNFIRKIGDFLVKNEAANNLLLGLIYSLLEREMKGEKLTDTFMGAVDDFDGNLVLVVLMNRINLIVSGEGMEIDSAIDNAVTYLYKSGRDVPGVVGPTAIARQFAFEWATKKKIIPFVKMNQRIYQLDKVNPIQFTSGRLQLADINDLELVTDWIYEFCESIDEKIVREEAIKLARENLENSSLYIWKDQDFVSMAKKTRPTKNGIVLSLVYTPPVFRNKGYASSCVASLSQLLLDEGYKFCSLYTDLSNPTSNDIYSKIGYHPIQDSIMYRFR